MHRRWSPILLRLGPCRACQLVDHSRWQPELLLRHNQDGCPQECDTHCRPTGSHPHAVPQPSVHHPVLVRWCTCRPTECRDLKGLQSISANIPELLSPQIFLRRSPSRCLGDKTCDRTVAVLRREHAQCRCGFQSWFGHSCATRRRQPEHVASEPGRVNSRRFQIRFEPRSFPRRDLHRVSCC